MNFPGEIEIQFVKNPRLNYPDLRCVTVILYGGSEQECIERARKELRLGDEWRVVRSDVIK